MRIALAHPYSWPDVLRGGERYLEDLAWYLAGAGHEVEVLTGTRGGDPVEGGAERMVRRRYRSGASEAGFAARLVGALVRRRYDVVHAMLPSVALGARVTGHATVFSVLGHPSERWLRSGRLRRRSWPMAVRSAGAVTALSRSAAAAVRDLTGRDAEVVPIGIRTDRFTPELSPRTGPARILFASHLSAPMKALPTTVRAFARLLDDHPDARLQLVGQGDPGGALAGLPPHVRDAIDVVGPRPPDEMPDRYRDATVTVLASRDEAQGLVLIESLACGTPGVGSDWQGPAETLDRPEVGRTAPFGDVPALAQALREAVALAADPATPRLCAEHARRWDWERIGPLHEEVYRRVARGPGGSP